MLQKILKCTITARRRSDRDLCLRTLAELLSTLQISTISILSLCQTADKRWSLSSHSSLLLLALRRVREKVQKKKALLGQATSIRSWRWFREVKILFPKYPVDKVPQIANKKETSHNRPNNCFYKMDWPAKCWASISTRMPTQFSRKMQTIFRLDSPVIEKRPPLWTSQICFKIDSISNLLKAGTRLVKGKLNCSQIWW